MILSLSSFAVGLVPIFLRKFLFMVIVSIIFIYFSVDIVGFTNISSQLEPRKVADMLDRLYTKFDRLSQEHDIFKVETIGDAYVSRLSLVKGLSLGCPNSLLHLSHLFQMAVSNLVKDQPNDHTKRIAEFAIDAIVAANETFIDLEAKSRGCVNIRVGFHSGPVVADGKFGVDEGWASLAIN